MSPISPLQRRPFRSGLIVLKRNRGMAGAGPLIGRPLADCRITAATSAAGPGKLYPGRLARPGSELAAPASWAEGGHR